MTIHLTGNLLFYKFLYQLIILEKLIDHIKIRYILFLLSGLRSITIQDH